MALRIYEAALGADHPRVATGRVYLAQILHGRGKLGEAETEVLAARATLTEALGPAHPHVARARYLLAMLLYDKAEYPEAEAEARAVLEPLKRASGAEHPRVAYTHHLLGMILFEQGKYDEAEEQLRASLAIADKADGDEPWHAPPRLLLGEILMEKGRIADARPLLERAWPVLQADDTVSAADKALAAFTLAQAVWPTGDRPRARALAQEARAFSAQGGDAKQMKEIEAWRKTLR